MPTFSQKLRSMLTNILILTFSTLALAYLGLMLFAYVMADKMIFPYSGSTYQDSPEIKKLPTSDKNQVSTLYLPVEGSQHLLLYSHGNGEDLGDILAHLEIFQSRGLSVLAYDYPGYGTSTGRASEASVFAAADAVYQYATQKLGYAPEQITLYGRSLGSGPSCWLAERYPVRSLILDGAFSSTFRVITHIRILPWDRFNNLSRWSSISCPVLILHGTEDMTVPLAHAKQNAQAVRGEVTTVWVEDAGHNNLIEQLGSTYWDTVLPFAGKAL
ncbi:MAG: alpha/beta hydrolase [Opitutales bacterium]|jgi:abhydrolase domain-containing protein 17|nr:alpha/beta hydrolase [Opitutales bacterium]MDP4644748.1 alpha/beta hydrolase [Opitutales bacterium]MDP4693792.1 alpha/beta hydrolase [Opitutales bacterium]MDP4777974.1 alpha/beta hydrolase [Opitutales bacterium]MDP4882964.1 alpha/beta hydrolase [Opitutales bacterium]